MSTFPDALPIYRTLAIRAIEAHYLAGAKPSLMERAGAAAAKVALEITRHRPGPVLVLAGPGNNGGDAFVLARRLREANKEVTVCFLGDVSLLSEDAALAITAFGAIGGEVRTNLPADTQFALAVDGLFGIGLQRAITGPYAQWIDYLNALPCPVLAIDVPSGLDSDTGQIWGTAVRATHTATFIAAKPGLFSLHGPDHAGEISVFDLSLDVAAVRQPEGLTVSPDLFHEFLTPRARNSHKGSFGSVGIFGGNTGMVGAALLAGRAALLSGAGRVFVGLLDATGARVDPTQPELMIRDAQTLQASRLATCMAIGPGLGTNDNAHSLLTRILSANVPLLLDADALNLLAADPNLVRQTAYRQEPTLATPHPAEAARLLNCRTEEIQSDRMEAACEIARRLRAWTVLKGVGSVIAAPDGRWWINTSGNPGMASAGMGDVLSGIAVSLLAQNWHPEAALLAAVHLHGAAADACVAAGQGPIGLTAGEVIPAARQVLNGWVAALHA